MSYFQLQTVHGGNFRDKFLLNRVESMSFLNGKLSVRFKTGASEQYSVTEEISDKILANWETWCADQTKEGMTHSLDTVIEDMGRSFEQIMADVDKEFKQALITRTDETMSKVDELFSKLAPRYEALEAIARTFEKYLGEGAPK